MQQSFLAVGGPGHKGYWNTCVDQVLDICEYLGRVGCSEFLLLGTQAPTSSPQEFAAEDTLGV